MKYIRDILRNIKQYIQDNLTNTTDTYVQRHGKHNLKEIESLLQENERNHNK